MTIAQNVPLDIEIEAVRLSEEDFAAELEALIDQEEGETKISCGFVACGTASS